MPQTGGTTGTASQGTRIATRVGGDAALETRVAGRTTGIADRMTGTVDLRNATGVRDGAVQAVRATVIAVTARGAAVVEVVVAAALAG